MISQLLQDAVLISHTLGQDWGGRCLLSGQQKVLVRSPVPIAECPCTHRPEDAQDQAFPLAVGEVCQAGSGEDGRGIPSAGCSPQAEDNLLLYTERPLKRPGLGMQMTGGLPALFGVQKGVITNSSGFYCERAAQRLLQMVPCPVPAAAPRSQAVGASLCRGPPRPARLPGEGEMHPAVGGRLRGEETPLHPPAEGWKGISLCPGSQQHPGVRVLARRLPAHPGMSVPRFPAHAGVPLPPSLLSPAYRCSGCPLTPGCRCPGCLPRPRVLIPVVPGDAGTRECLRPAPCSSLGCRSHGPRRAPGCPCPGSPPLPGMPVPRVPAMPVPAAPRVPEPGPAPPLTCLGAAPAAACAPGAEPRSPAGPAAAEARRGRRRRGSPGGSRPPPLPRCRPPARPPGPAGWERGGEAGPRSPGGCSGAGAARSLPVLWGGPGGGPRAPCRGEGWGCLGMPGDARGEPTRSPGEAHRDGNTGDPILAKPAGGLTQLRCEAGGFWQWGRETWARRGYAAPITFPYLLEAPLAAGTACGTAGGSRGGGTGLVWHLPIPALCKATQVASAALGGLSPLELCGVQRAVLCCRCSG